MRHILALAFTLTVLLTATVHVRGQTLGTAFTYQGQLKQSGNPLNNTADFEFKLFNALSGASQIGSTQLVNAVNIVDGVFTVSLDFGSSPFTGDKRWLEVAVRSPAGNGNFTTLTPRQPLTAAPYALYALTGPGSGGPWAVNGNHVHNTNTGGIGIGTSNPAATVHAKKFQPVIVLQDTNIDSQQASYLGFWNNSGAETGWLGFGSPGIPDLFMVNGRFAGDIRLLPGPGGEVRLDAEQYAATAGEESLRIIRGRVNANGDVVSGSGFTAVRDAEGQYTIIYNTPFAGTPTVVASIEYQQGVFELAVDTVSTGQTKVYTWNANKIADNAFHFIAIGQR